MNEPTLPKPGNGVSQHALPGHSHNPLSAYCYYPDGIDFSDKDPEEKIILLVRKHPITNLKWLFVIILMILTPVVLQVFPILAFAPARFQFMAVIIWYLLTTAFVFQSFLTWFYNVNIITNKRVVDVNFVNLLYKQVTDAEIEKIQDVTFTVGSVIRTMFDFGDVLIQTAAEVENIQFEAIPHPDQVSKILHELREENKDV